MLIAIISDIHDNIPNLDKCLSWCKENKIESLIFCGDTARIETAEHISKEFAGEIFMTRGNAELYSESELEKYKNIHYVGEIGLIELGGLLIGICHQPEKIDQAIEISSSDPDFIFYGHTHKPWIEKRGLTTVANPGELSNAFNRPTFAVLDTATKKLDLKILATL